MSGTLLQRILVMPTQINKTKVPLISRGQCVNWYTKITTFHGAIFPEAGRFFVGISPTPGRSKVSFYGVYIYNLGEVRIFPNDTANGLNTIDVLNALKTEFPNHPMTLIWDGAPYHRSQIVKDAAATLGIKIEPLPSYSPDFLPVEHLWQWLRQDITYHTCYERPSDLIEQVSAFQQQINASPNTVADRLWVTTHLKPDEEKLRVST